MNISEIATLDLFKLFTVVVLLSTMRSYGKCLSLMLWIVYFMKDIPLCA